jgi:hypothetical protein
LSVNRDLSWTSDVGWFADIQQQSCSTKINVSACDDLKPLTHMDLDCGRCDADDKNCWGPKPKQVNFAPAWTGCGSPAGEQKSETQHTARERLGATAVGTDRIRKE